MSNAQSRKRKTISPRIRFEVLKRDGFACAYCGRGASGSLPLVIDHVEAFANGGADDLSNYAAACVECNAGKSDREVLVDGTLAASAQAEPSTLVGRHFHHFNHSHPSWPSQGRVEMDHGFALEVRYYSWNTGDQLPWTEMVDKNQIFGELWRWYATNEEMRDEGESAMMIETRLGMPMSEEFLARLQEAGILVTLNGDRLNLVAPVGVLTPELLAEVRARKPEIIKLLTPSDPE